MTKFLVECVGRVAGSLIFCIAWLLTALMDLFFGRGPWTRE